MEVTTNGSVESAQKSAIDFYFDFSSPYGYLAATRINALAAKHGRRVHWRPILLGVAFKSTGNAPLIMQPLKGPYSLRDFKRSARFMGVPFNIPAQFPIATHQAARAYYWLYDKNPLLAHKFAMTAFVNLYVDGVDISSVEKVGDMAALIGENRDEVIAAINEQSVKDRLKNEVDAAIARGVFGSPFIFVDDEPFWGNDRLNQVEAWLETGGF
jgi:2-hydroxychromene-2-carboxylate isomerase